MPNLAGQFIIAKRWWRPLAVAFIIHCLPVRMWSLQLMQWAMRKGTYIKWIDR